MMSALGAMPVYLPVAPPLPAAVPQVWVPWPPLLAGSNSVHEPPLISAWVHTVP